MSDASDSKTPYTPEFDAVLGSDAAAAAADEG